MKNKKKLTSVGRHSMAVLLMDCENDGSYNMVIIFNLN